MKILAIDPGNEYSAWISYDVGLKRPTAFAKETNEMVMASIEDAWLQSQYDHVVIEMVQSFGMAVGAEVFETVFWVGRFFQAVNGGPGCHRIYRKEIKSHLCGTHKAKDANIRQVLIDRYGGKEKAIGKKKTPGPLYGISKDCWSALAIAITFCETVLDKKSQRE